MEPPEELVSILFAPSLQVSIGTNKIPSLPPPFSHHPKPLFSRLHNPSSLPFLTGEMLLPLHQLKGTSLNSLQYIHVCLVLRSLELDAALQMWPHPKVIFCLAAFQLSGSQHVLVHGAVPSHMQDFALPLVEFHEVPASLFLQPVDVPLYVSTILWSISHSSQFCIIRKLEGTLYPSLLGRM